MLLNRDANGNFPKTRLTRRDLLGFAANQLFVWILVKQLGGPTWWPVVPIIFVTPILTFTLHRRWVYV